MAHSVPSSPRGERSLPSPTERSPLLSADRQSARRVESVMAPYRLSRNPLLEGVQAPFSLGRPVNEGSETESLAGSIYAVSEDGDRFLDVIPEEEDLCSIHAEEDDPRDNVHISMKTSDGIAVAFRKERLQEHQGRLNQAFTQLERLWLQYRQETDPTFTMHSCCFNLGHQIVRYKDQEGNWHSKGLEQELERDEFKKCYEELRAVAGKIWGETKTRRLILARERRHSAQSAYPFLRNQPAEKALEVGKGEKREEVANTIESALALYKSYLQRLDPPLLTEEEISQELKVALQRIEKVEVTLREIKTRIEEAIKSEQEQIRDIQAVLNALQQDKEELQKKLTDPSVPDKTGLKAQLMEREQSIRDKQSDITRYQETIKQLQGDLQRYNQVDRLALYAAAAFASDWLLSPGQEAATEEELKIRARNLAEQLVTSLQEQLKQKHAAWVEQEVEAVGRAPLDLYRKVRGQPSLKEQIRTQAEGAYDGKSSFAIDVGGLILHTLPAHMECRAHRGYLQAHQASSKRESVEASLIAFVFGRDRRVLEENAVLPEVSLDLQRTLYLSHSKVEEIQGVRDAIGESGSSVDQTLEEAQQDLLNRLFDSPDFATAGSSSGGLSRRGSLSSLPGEEGEASLLDEEEVASLSGEGGSEPRIPPDAAVSTIRSVASAVLGGMGAIARMPFNLTEAALRYIVPDEHH